MAKTHTTITIDPFLIEEAKQFNINISEVCNNALNSFLRTKKNVNHINIEIRKKELEEKQKKISQLQPEILSLQEEIRLFEEKLKSLELEDLKKQEELENKKILCYCCNLQVENEKLVHIENGLVVHKACFYSNFDKLKGQGLIRI